MNEWKESNRESFDQAKATISQVLSLDVLVSYNDMQLNEIRDMLDCASAAISTLIRNRRHIATHLFHPTKETPNK